MTEALLPAVASLALQLQPVEGRPFARVAGPGAARAASPCELVAMDAAGRELGRARVGAGEVDLAAALPAMRAAPRAVRGRALPDGGPGDAALAGTPREARP
ncbi:MAG: hypothetical protein ACKORL_06275, partial [Phycisphaerales bacterium]